MNILDINKVLSSENPSGYLCKYAWEHGRLSPKWERLFLEFKDAHYIIFYAEYIIKKRWPKAEPILLEFKDVWNIIRYATNCLKRRWPKAEPLIRQNKWMWKDYCEFFNIKEEDGHK